MLGFFFFEDPEAAIKMIIRGRRPTMRHVSRTHRVALDWLFDRVDLEPKIQSKKYVDSKNQLGHTLSRGSFSRDEGNHFLCLFNITSFSMFSCSHFSVFPTIRLERRAPCHSKWRLSDGKAEDQQFWRRRDPLIWWCAVRGVRKTLRKVWCI